MQDKDFLKWYALYTKPRHEKAVERNLCSLGIEAFTPKRVLKRRWSDRVMVVEEPLFSNYCFVRTNLQEKNKIVSQKGVVDFVHFNGEYPWIREEVIDSLKILLDNKIRLDPYPYIEIGSRVVIKKGPLKGVEGYIIEKRSNNARLVISVEAIASSVQFVVDADFVELS